MYFHPLNFIRFILAIGVVLFHYGILYPPFNSGYLHTLIINTSFRVSFFFFISGFVMMLVYATQGEGLSASTFYKKRLTRILPMFWLAFVLTLLLVVTVLDAGPKGGVIVTHFLGLQSFYPGYVLDLNYPAWTISVEFFFYALFPFLMKWMHKISLERTIWATAIIWMLQTIQHIVFVDYLWNGTKPMEEFISDFPLWHLATFICGMTSARIVLRNYTMIRIQKFATPCFLLSLAALCFFVFVPNPVLKYAHNGLFAPLFALLVISLFYDRSAIHRFLSQPAVSKLGDLSYGLFIFQYPVWIICKRVSTLSFSGTSLFFLIYLVVLIIFAWAMNRFVEKPLLNYMRETQKQRAVRE
jgi:peptidoglycan/LPS O-acetylase OafA/YrhL